jgi:hypothetical protein
MQAGAPALLDRLGSRGMPVDRHDEVAGAPWQDQAKALPSAFLLFGVGQTTATAGLRRDLELLDRSGFGSTGR